MHFKEIPKPAKNFQFKPILQNELMRAIQKQKNSRSGNIPIRFLKDAASCVPHSLSVAFSKSFEQGRYPDNLKLARISAIYKGKVQSQTLTTIDQYQSYQLWPGSPT